MGPTSHQACFYFVGWLILLTAATAVTIHYCQKHLDVRRTLSPDSPQGGVQTKLSLCSTCSKLKSCSLRLIRLVLSRCAGSGGHYPSVSKRDRRSAATVPFSLSLVPMHQCHTGRVTAGRTESGGCGEGSAAAPHCDEADSMADWPTNRGGRSRRWPSDCCTDLTQVWITHLLNPLWGPRLDCNSLWILRYIYITSYACYVEELLIGNHGNLSSYICLLLDLMLSSQDDF